MLNVSKYNIQSQIHNRPSFKALKTMNYQGRFAPLEVADDANIVSAIQNNSAFQKFFEKFDAIISFKCEKFQTSYKINMRYAEVQPETTEPLFKRIKKHLSFKRDTRTWFETDIVANSQNAASQMLEKLKNITFEDLMQIHKTNLDNLKKI